MDTDDITHAENVRKTLNAFSKKVDFHASHRLLTTAHGLVMLSPVPRWKLLYAQATETYLAGTL